MATLKCVAVFAGGLPPGKTAGDIITTVRVIDDIELAASSEGPLCFHVPAAAAAKLLQGAYRFGSARFAFTIANEAVRLLCDGPLPPADDVVVAALRVWGVELIPADAANDPALYYVEESAHSDVVALQPFRCGERVCCFVSTASVPPRPTEAAANATATEDPAGTAAEDPAGTAAAAVDTTRAATDAAPPPGSLPAALPTRVAVFHDANDCYIPSDDGIDGSKLYDLVLREALALHLGQPADAAAGHVPALQVAWKMVLPSRSGSPQQPTERVLRQLKQRGVQEAYATMKDGNVDSTIKEEIRAMVEQVKASSHDEPGRVLVVLLLSDGDYFPEVRKLRGEGFPCVVINKGDSRPELSDIVRTPAGEMLSPRWAELVASATDVAAVGAVDAVGAAPSSTVSSVVYEWPLEFKLRLLLDQPWALEALQAAVAAVTDSLHVGVVTVGGTSVQLRAASLAVDPAVAARAKQAVDDFFSGSVVATELFRVHGVATETLRKDARLLQLASACRVFVYLPRYDRSATVAGGAVPRGTGALVGLLAIKSADVEERLAKVREAIACPDQSEARIEVDASAAYLLRDRGSDARRPKPGQFLLHVGDTHRVAVTLETSDAAAAGATGGFKTEVVVRGGAAAVAAAARAVTEKVGDGVAFVSHLPVPDALWNQASLEQLFAAKDEVYQKALASHTEPPASGARAERLWNEHLSVIFPQYRPTAPKNRIVRITALAHMADAAAEAERVISQKLQEMQLNGLRHPASSPCVMLPDVRRRPAGTLH